MSRVRIVIDRAAVARLADEEARKAATRAAGKAALLAKANVAKAERIRTGAMRQSIRTLDTASSGGKTTVTVGSDVRYALWQELGVKGPIRPRKGRYLVFVPKWKHYTVWARQVRGFPGAHFMRDAAAALTMRDFLGR